MAKPGRSEEAEAEGDAQQQADAIRQKFADAAPQRPLKPSRSDHFPDASADTPLPDVPIPEHLKLQYLLHSSPGQVVIQEFTSDTPKEFVETEYYTDLRAADQTLHHTTGTGFIQVQSNRVVDYTSLPDAPIVRTEASMVQYSVEAPEEFVETEYYNDLNAVDKSLHHTTGSGFIQVEKDGVVNLNFSSPAELVRTKSGCNPATNDWIPAANAMEAHASAKPHRSEP